MEALGGLLGGQGAGLLGSLLGGGSSGGGSPLQTIASLLGGGDSISNGGGGSKGLSTLMDVAQIAMLFA